MKRFKTTKLEPVPIDERHTEPAMERVNALTVKHEMVLSRTKGQDTVARVNALIKHSGVGIWVQTYIGLVAVVELRMMAEGSYYIYVLCLDYRKEARGFILPWNAEFKLFLGAP